MSISQHVKGTSRFSTYRNGILYYVTEDTGLEFPVPTSDIEGAGVQATEKSIFFMRWIRKHLAMLGEQKGSVSGEVTLAVV